MSTRAQETRSHALSPALVDTLDLRSLTTGSDEFVIASRSAIRSSIEGSRGGACAFVSCDHAKFVRDSRAAQAATASNPIFRTPAMPAIIASSLSCSIIDTHDRRNSRQVAL